MDVLYCIHVVRCMYSICTSTAHIAVQRDRATSGLERAMERERQFSDELDALRESALRSEKLQRDADSLRHKCLRAEQRAADAEVVFIQRIHMCELCDCLFSCHNVSSYMRIVYVRCAVLLFHLIFFAAQIQMCSKRAV